MPLQDKGRQVPPTLDEFLDQINKFFKRGRLGFSTIIGIIVVIWMASGIYIVAPDERGVVKRFGKFVYVTMPGPHWHVPWPVETAIKPQVTKVRRLEIGFRTIYAGPPARYRSIPSESLMLTGDENIINIQFIVQYKIKDASDYLFNVKNPEDTVRIAAEASMREVIGKNKIDDALTVGKYKMQQDTKYLLQQILDSYQVGISIEAVQLQDVHPPKEVMAAFKDVASAKEDKIKTINESEAYRNEILPKAKGKASQVTNEALAYKEAKIKYAQGDASRFDQILKEYRKSKKITRKRLYLEAMEEILPGMNKILIDAEMGKNLLPFLPLKGSGAIKAVE